MSRSSALWWVTNGRAAAPPASVSSTGVSTSVKPRSTSVARIAAITADRDVEHAPGLRVGDQVEVALAQADLGIGQPAVLVRQRAQRLGEQPHLGHLDGELAGVGGHHGAGGADPVAAVERLDPLERRFAERVARGEQLDAAGLVLERGEDRAAVAADQHQRGRPRARARR